MTELLRASVDRYVALLQNALRPTTSQGYRYQLSAFVDFLKTNYPEVRSFVDLRRDPHIESWLRFLARKDPPYCNTTRRGHLFRVRRFLRDLHDYQWRGAPTSELILPLDFPLPDRPLPRALSTDIDRALQDAFSQRNDIIGCGLLIARFTGLRIGELVRLERQSLQCQKPDQFSLRVPLGKLHNERLVPVDPQTAHLIETLRAQSEKRPPSKDPVTGRSVELLLCEPDGRLMDVKKFQRAMRKMGRALGLKERVYPHRLRHTYATELIRCGVALPAVMRLLGHHDIRMTMRYVTITQADAMIAFHRATPRIQQRYGSLGEDLPPLPTHSSLDHPSIQQRLEAVVDQLKRMQLDEQDPKHRLQLYRFLERLRRAQQQWLNLNK